VEDLYGSLSEKRGGIENISIMCASPAERGEVLSRVACIEGIRIIFPWATDLEIVSEDADKGEAFLDLAAELGIPAGEVMAMGDGNNDLGLMRAAGLSVAMGNSDHEVIAAADHITADNEHDGVAEAILKFVL
jgi:hydroxymethylpyrimidine pyrophosphatase-like HAD family hydrolase